MDLYNALKKSSNKEKSEILKRFFKTGEGEYGEKDLFLGVMVPQQREIVRKYGNKISLKQVKKSLYSKFHEERLTALLILVKKYESSEEDRKKSLVNFYLKNLRQVNNWDLVDLSSPKILGDFLLKRNKDILYSLAKSKNIWERRVAIVSTLTLIKNNQFQDTLRISKLLLSDPHDLINKAVGWMLREVGKKDTQLLESFLEKNYRQMSRVTLRYSIEKFSNPKRKYFLTKQ